MSCFYKNNENEYVYIAKKEEIDKVVRSKLKKIFPNNDFSPLVEDEFYDKFLMLDLVNLFKKEIKDIPINVSIVIKIHIKARYEITLSNMDLQNELSGLVSTIERV